MSSRTAAEVRPVRRHSHSFLSFRAAALDVVGASIRKYSFINFPAARPFSISFYWVLIRLLLNRFHHLFSFPSASTVLVLVASITTQNIDSFIISYDLRCSGNVRASFPRSDAVSALPL